MKMVAWQIHLLRQSGNVQRAQYATHPTNILYAQSAGVPGLEISSERPAAKAADHTRKMVGGKEGVK
jgi:hypothetical protein